MKIGRVLASVCGGCWPVLASVGGRVLVCVGQRRWQVLVCAGCVSDSWSPAGCWQVSRLLRSADALLGHSERALPVQLTLQAAAPVGRPRADLCYLLRWSGLPEALLVLLQTPACLASSRLVGAARQLLTGQWLDIDTGTDTGTDTDTDTDTDIQTPTLTPTQALTPTPALMTDTGTGTDDAYTPRRHRYRH